MGVPVSGRRVDQIIDRIEHGQLHIRMDAMGHGETAIGQVKQNGVLVGDSGRTDDATRGAIELERVVGARQTMEADPPGRPRPRCGQIRVGHVPRAGGSSHPLHPRVLVGPDAIVISRCQHTGEVIIEPIAGVEQEHIGAVVEESGSARRVGRVPLTHTASKEMESAILVDQTGVENGSVSRYVAGGHDRLGAKALCGGGKGSLGWGGHGGHPGRVGPSDGGFGGMCVVMIGRSK